MEGCVEFTTSSTNLANNLVGQRRRRKLSQAALSAKSLVPRSTIALLESGQSNPTLNVILAICEVLNIGVDELLATPRGEYRLIKAKYILCKDNSKGDVSQFKLLPDAIFGMEIDRMEFGPGARLKGTPHVDHTKEYLTCIEGTIKLYIEGTNFVLEAGDVLAFPGDRPHTYLNPAKKKCTCFSVVIPNANQSM
jgi:transcriptional regulator with XRE-family HTH domain